MQHINNFVITLVATIIFMSAVEIISPDNSMKKYIKFVLGLILISVMINPIVKFFTGGEKELVNTIKKYENIFDENKEIESKDNISKSKIDAFNNNLNNNCDNLLKDKFENKEFKSNVKCQVDLEKMTYVIDSVEVKVKDNSIKLVDKININKKDKTSSSNIQSEENKIKDYLSEVFKIPKDKIKVYKLEE